MVTVEFVFVFFFLRTGNLNRCRTDAQQSFHRRIRPWMECRGNQKRKNIIKKTTVATRSLTFSTTERFQPRSSSVVPEMNWSTTSSLGLHWISFNLFDQNIFISLFFTLDEFLLFSVLDGPTTDETPLNDVIGRPSGRANQRRRFHFQKGSSSKSSVKTVVALRINRKEKTSASDDIISGSMATANQRRRSQYQAATKRNPVKNSVNADSNQTDKALYCFTK